MNQIRLSSLKLWRRNIGQNIFKLEAEKQKALGAALLAVIFAAIMQITAICVAFVVGGDFFRGHSLPVPLASQQQHRVLLWVYSLFSDGKTVDKCVVRPDSWPEGKLYPHYFQRISCYVSAMDILLVIVLKCYLGFMDLYVYNLQIYILTHLVLNF